jgi:hypothetical protein
MAECVLRGWKVIGFWRWNLHLVGLCLSHRTSLLFENFGEGGGQYSNRSLHLHLDLNISLPLLRECVYDSMCHTWQEFLIIEAELVSGMSDLCYLTTWFLARELTDFSCHTKRNTVTNVGSCMDFTTITTNRCNLAPFITMYFCSYVKGKKRVTRCYVYLYRRDSLRASVLWDENSKSISFLWRCGIIHGTCDSQKEIKKGVCSFFVLQIS